MTLIVVMISQVCTYFQNHQFMYINYPQLFGIWIIRNTVANKNKYMFIKPHQIVTCNPYKSLNDYINCT